MIACRTAPFRQALWIAKDGNDAIEIYLSAKETDQPFDLVILDMTIEDPEVKTIVASGYSKDPIISNYKAFGFKGVAKKPFSIEELSKIIDQVVFS